MPLLLEVILQAPHITGKAWECWHVTRKVPVVSEKQGV